MLNEVHYNNVYFRKLNTVLKLQKDVERCTAFEDGVLKERERLGDCVPVFLNTTIYA